MDNKEYYFCINGVDEKGNLCYIKGVGDISDFESAYGEIPTDGITDIILLPYQSYESSRHLPSYKRNEDG